jgi:hypothetical protein
VDRPDDDEESEGSEAESEEKAESGSDEESKMEESVSKVEESDNEAGAEESKSAVVRDGGADPSKEEEEKAMPLLSSIVPDSALLSFGEQMVLSGVEYSELNEAMQHPEVKSHLTHDKTSITLQFMGKKLDPRSTRNPNAESRCFLYLQDLIVNLIQKEKQVHHSAAISSDHMEKNKGKKVASESSKYSCSFYHCNVNELDILTNSIGLVSLYFHLFTTQCRRGWKQHEKEKNKHESKDGLANDGNGKPKDSNTTSGMSKWLLLHYLSDELSDDNIRKSNAREAVTVPNT